MKKEERLRVYKMYDGHCAYCGKSIKYENMQVDHIVPMNKGGKTVSDNLQILCRFCNGEKGDA